MIEVVMKPLKKKERREKMELLLLGIVLGLLGGVWLVINSLRE